MSNLTFLQFMAGALFGAPTAPVSTLEQWFPICYPEIGCFSKFGPHDSPMRPVPLPAHPENVTNTFILYTRKTKRLEVEVYPNISPKINETIDPSHRTFFITHGFSHHGNLPWVQDLAEAILEQIDANIFIVDWGKGAINVSYPQAVANVQVAAAVTRRVAEYVLSLGVKGGNMELIGHSLGAHVMSLVAKDLSTQVRLLTGLDAAALLFDGYSKEIGFAPDDAATTIAIKTSELSLLPIAHINIQVNEGGLQPSCVKFEAMAGLLNYVFDISSLYCSHAFSYDIYTQAVRNPECFIAKSRKGAENSSKIMQEGFKDVDSECVPLGLYTTNFTKSGDYLLKTSTKQPFCTQ